MSQKKSNEVLFTVYLLSRQPFSRRSCEADNSAVAHHPRGHGADGHTVDGLWGRELHKSLRPGGQLEDTKYSCHTVTFRKPVVHFSVSQH